MVYKTLHSEQFEDTKGITIVASDYPFGIFKLFTV
jgi:hypothetical protein